MKIHTYLFVSILFVNLLTGCGTGFPVSNTGMTIGKTLDPLMSPSGVGSGSLENAVKGYLSFVKNPVYPSTDKNFFIIPLLREGRAGKPVEIEVFRQSGRLIVKVDGIVALDASVFTGRAGAQTPAGRYTVIVRNGAHRSPIYGDLYLQGRLVGRGDRRQARGPYDRFVGASQPNYLGLNSRTSRDAPLGIFATSNRPANGTNGELIISPKTARLLFEITKVGQAIVIR